MWHSPTSPQAPVRASGRRWLHRAGMLLRSSIALGVGGMVTLLPGRTLQAQAGGGVGAIAGIVRDTAGVGIAGAQVTLVGTTLRAQTDESGTFRLTSVRAGPASMQVRRLGFRAVDVELTVQPARTVQVTLILPRTAQELEPVVVRRGDRRYTGPFAEFNRRRAAGFGHFLTRDDINRHQMGRLTDVLRRIPGARIVSDEFGLTGVRLRGMSCPPLVWVDGTPAGAAQYDLDAIPPQTVEALEVYSDIATVPVELRGSGGLGSCGVIVIWTRHGEPRRKRRPGTVQVYTAEQVDVPAWPDPAAPVRPAYPDSLYRARVGGSVIAVFVVDTAGRVDTDTFHALSSAHPLFTAAVRQALASARFVPAVRRGRTVRQLVRLPFRFMVARRGG